MTPIHLAAKHGQTEIVKLFLEKNVDVDTPGMDGTTALHNAAQSGYC